MNKKGFTLIELLAVLVILSIIMGIAIPNIVSILDKNKKENYIADAKKFVALAKTELSTRLNKPNSDEVVVVSLSCVDNQDIDVDANGNKYNKNNSFVAVFRSEDEYKYYVYLINDGNANNNRGVSLVNVDDLDGDDRLQFVGKGVDKISEDQIIGELKKMDSKMTASNLRGDLMNASDTVKCASNK